jgi:hypothetical protein
MKIGIGSRDPRSQFCGDQVASKEQEVDIRHFGTLDNLDTGYVLEDRSAWTIECIIHRIYERGDAVVAYGATQGVRSHDDGKDCG